MSSKASKKSLTSSPVVKDAVGRIVEGFDPDQIIVFGSRAKGEAKGGSDLDLLVILSHVESRRETRIAIRVALIGLGVPKDVIVATREDLNTHGKLPGTVLKSALEEGVVVYERVA